MAEMTAAETVLVEGMDRLPVGVVFLNGDLETLYCNPVAGRLLGSMDGVLARLSAGCAEAPTGDWMTEARGALAAGEEKHCDNIPWTDAEGGNRVLAVTAIPLDGAGKEVIRAERADRSESRGGCEQAALLLVIEDVTTVRDLEKRLAIAESMAAVGRLAARVAHELNNPLDGSLRYINLCLRLLDGEADDRPASYLEKARQGLTRMARIVSELLEFSRNAPMLRSDSNINWLVQEAIQSMSDHADANRVMVAAAFHDDRNMPAIEGARLFQVCCNLIKNAIDAMPDGGCLTVTTGITDGHVVIRFEDTGVGLPAEIERIFEPFYTTKAAGQGTGLGLAICKDYIEQLDGEIIAERGKEKGSVFTVRIPVSSCIVRSDAAQQVDVK